MANRRRAPNAHFTSHAPPRAAPSPNARPAPDPKPSPRRFVPVPRYQRSDGWTAEAQVAFIEALTQSGCITEACKAVGKSRASVYRLRADPQATSFRIAWENALDVAVRRIADNAYSRALHGVVTPIFYQGEQIGERVRHDERLVMFLLRYRDPLHYGRAQDRVVPDGHLESAAARLRESLEAVDEDAAKAELAAEAEEEAMAELAREEAEEEAAFMAAQAAASAAASAPAPARSVRPAHAAHAKAQDPARRAAAKAPSRTATQATGPASAYATGQAAAPTDVPTAAAAAVGGCTDLTPAVVPKAAARSAATDAIGRMLPPIDVFTEASANAPIGRQAGGNIRTGAGDSDADVSSPSSLSGVKKE